MRLGVPMLHASLPRRLNRRLPMPSDRQRHLEGRGGGEAANHGGGRWAGHRGALEPPGKIDQQIDHKTLRERRAAALRRQDGLRRQYGLRRQDSRHGHVDWPAQRVAFRPVADDQRVARPFGADRDPVAGTEGGEPSAIEHTVAIAHEADHIDGSRAGGARQGATPAVGLRHGKAVATESAEAGQQSGTAAGRCGGDLLGRRPGPGPALPRPQVAMPLQTGQAVEGVAGKNDLEGADGAIAAVPPKACPPGGAAEFPKEGPHRCAWRRTMHRAVGNRPVGCDHEHRNPSPRSHPRYRLHWLAGGKSLVAGRGYAKAPRAFADPLASGFFISPIVSWMLLCRHGGGIDATRIS